MSEQLKAAVRRFFEEGVSTGRMDGVEDLFAADIVMHSPFGDVQRLDGLRDMSEAFHRALPQGRITVEDVVVEGDRVAWRLRGAGRHDGPFMHLQATGREVAWTNVDLAHLRDDKVVELWGGPDLFAILTQMGAIPAPPQPAPA